MFITFILLPFYFIEYGFLLPADQIIPNALEIIDGLKAMVKEAKLLHYL